MFRRLACWASVLLLAACGDGLGPDRGPPSLYELDGFEYSCGGWFPAEPAVPLGLFDIYFGRRFPNEDDDEPTGEQIRRVVANGGTVVHRFHVRMVRAIMSPEAVPALEANVTRSVPDASVFPVRILVGYKTVDDEAPLIEMIETLSGQVTHQLAFINALAAVVPDDAIPTLRTHRAVEYVEGDPVLCLA